MPFNLTKNKYFSNLTLQNNPDITKIKIEQKGDYYLIGTSRVMRISPNLFEQYLPNQKIYNINISGSTFKENFLLASKVKENKSNFIYGFDAFSLNVNRFSQQDLVKRYQSYKEVFEKKSNQVFYFSIPYFADSSKDVVKKILKKDLNQYESDENKKDCNCTIEGMEEHLDLTNQGRKKSYTNFELEDEANIEELAKIATKKDIFIVYPKHFYHYILFQKYQNIEEKYFNAIEILVKNTNAQVWIFYGINEITKNDKNFGNFSFFTQQKHKQV